MVSLKFRLSTWQIGIKCYGRWAKKKETMSENAELNCYTVQGVGSPVPANAVGEQAGPHSSSSNYRNACVVSPVTQADSATSSKETCKVVSSALENSVSRNSNESVPNCPAATDATSPPKRKRLSGCARRKRTRLRKLALEAINLGDDKVVAEQKSELQTELINTEKRNLSPEEKFTCVKRLKSIIKAESYLDTPTTSKSVLSDFKQGALQPEAKQESDSIQLIDEANQKTENVKPSQIEDANYAVIDTGCPSGRMSAERLNLLDAVWNDALTNQILQSNSNTPVFQLTGCHFDRGVFMVGVAADTCIDALCQMVNELPELWSGCKLRFVPKNLIPQLKKVMFCVKGHSAKLPSDTILTLLGKQNRDLRVDLWKVFYRTEASDGNLVIVGIDQDSLKTLKSTNGKAYLLSSTVTFMAVNEVVDKAKDENEAETPCFKNGSTAHELTLKHSTSKVIENIVGMEIEYDEIQKVGPVDNNVVSLSQGT